MNIKCNKCGHVLMSGSGAISLFGSGCKLGCLKCGNSVVLDKTYLLVDNQDNKNDNFRDATNMVEDQL